MRDADGVLDIFHVLEHVTATGKMLHSDSKACKQWCDEARTILLKSGWCGIEEFCLRDFEELNAVRKKSVNSLLDDLTPHKHHLNYGERLAAGKSGSSAILMGRNGEVTTESRRYREEITVKKNDEECTPVFV